MTDPRIAAVGAYAPRYRITAEEFEDAWGRFQGSGISKKAVPDADEDAVTMASEAATRALAAADLDGSDVAFLAFASATPPLAEEDLSVRLGEMLGVPNAATHHVFTGSTRAGTRALVAARDAGPWAEGVGLVVAADCPRGEPDSAFEHAAGAGGAAFVLDGDGPVAVTESVEYATEYPGTRFRESGEMDLEGLDVTAYDRQAFTETLSGAVSRLETDVSTVDAAAIQAPDGKLPYRAAKALGLDSEQVQRCVPVHDLGDLGAASVAVGVARALADGAGRVLAAAFGSGAGADALVLEASGDVPGDLALDGDEEVSYPEYLRLRGEITGEGPSGGGAYVSVPSWRRTLDQRYRLVAGRCPECGELAFPPEGACPNCGSLVEYDPVELPGTGTVEAVTVIGQGGAPPEFAEHQARSGAFAVAIVAFDGADGETVSAPAQVVGVDPESIEIGDAVAATIRRIYTQEGVTRYGFKVRPV
jgi:hydroxymethylglutaryl-CoA synthase